MTRLLLPILALALAPSALLGQENPATGVCSSGDPMPVIVPPQDGAALPAPAPGGVAPVPIPNACDPSNGSFVVRGTRLPGAEPAPGVARGAPLAGTEPLYVVDGVIRPKAETGDSPLKTIPAQEIDSITILKDRTATVRYGPQAQHGVVVIRTKKAQALPPQP